MVILILTFWGTAVLFFVVTSLFYILTNSAPIPGSTKLTILVLAIYIAWNSPLESATVLGIIPNVFESLSKKIYILLELLWTS